MRREQLRNFRDKELLHSGEGSDIYRIPNNQILKVSKSPVFLSCKLFGVSYEDKIKSTLATEVKEFVSPLTAVYNGCDCVGYTMDEVNGASLNDYDVDFTLEQRSDLEHYASLFSKIERVVKKANDKGIVIPDMCTCDNIILMPDGSIRFIDYDGMQLGPKDKTITMSTSLGDPRKYLTSSKFSNGMFNFTTELDKTSLTILMFLAVFNINLNKIGCFNPFLCEIVTLKSIFDNLGIKDTDFMEKVDANLSTKRKGYYIASELCRIAEKYRMTTYEIPNHPDNYVKKLRLK